MTTEVLLYELTLILVVGLSVYNIAYSAKIWLKLRLSLALLLVLWPLTVAAPTLVEIQMLHDRLTLGLTTGNMPWRWANLAVTGSITLLQLLVLRFGNGFRRKKDAS